MHMKVLFGLLGPCLMAQGVALPLEVACQVDPVATLPVGSQPPLRVVLTFRLQSEPSGPLSRIYRVESVWKRPNQAFFRRVKIDASRLDGMPSNLQGLWVRQLRYEIRDHRGKVLFTVPDPIDIYSKTTKDVLKSAMIKLHPAFHPEGHGTCSAELFVF